MGIVIRQSGVSTLFTYIGTLIGFANTVILFPAFLSAEQIGLIRALPSAAYMIMPIAQLGMARVLIKFAPEIRKTEDGLAQFTLFVLIRVLMGGLFAAGMIYFFQGTISILFAENAPLFNDYFYVVIVLVLILSLYTLLESYSRIFLKIVIVNIIREVLTRVMMSLGVSIYFLGWISFHQLTLGLIVVFAIALISVLGYLVWEGHFRISIQQGLINKDLKKRILSYAFFSLIGAGGGYVILNIDQIMVTSLVGLDANGIYTTAFFFAVMIELSRRAITQVTTPMVSEFFENKDLAAIKKIYKQVSINQMVIGLFLFIGITCNMHNVYEIMPNGCVYEAGYWVVFLIGIAKLVDMSFGNNGEIITMSDHYRFNVVTMAILAGFMIFLNYLLIPMYGINGAALATVSSVVIFNLIKMTFIKMKLGFVPFCKNSLILLAVSIVVFLVGFYLPQFDNPFFDVFVRSAVITGLYGLSVYFLKISIEINSLISQMLKIFK